MVDQKEINELEKKLQKMKWDKYEEDRKALESKKDKFSKENEIDIYGSDDYCGMSVGRFSFYYGYESTKCTKHPKKDKDWCEEHDCDWRERCFTAEIDDKEVMCLPTSELRGDGSEDIFYYLLSGIGQFIQEHIK